MPPAMASMMGGKEYSKEEIALSQAIMEVERTVKNVANYRNLLRQCPEYELQSVLNALNGGFVAPSPGGDPIVNPNTLPTGRNLYGVNAENTPSEAAWEKGKMLADQTIENYKHRHNDSVPRKVSYTLWSGEFIETEGATIAPVLYMLGVEPVRDAFGRVTDLRLRPSQELGRPRIDVVVQTSGQLRDLASSRLFLINRAVAMAAEAKGDKWSQEKWEEVATEFGDLLDQFSAKEDDYGMMKKLRVLGATTKFYAAATKYVVAPEAKAKLKGLTDDNDESVEGEEGEGEALEGLDKAISETADNIADALKGLGF